MYRVPREWWDIVLDGSTYRVDVSATPYLGLNPLRTAAYREAESRRTNVATHKGGPALLLIQAWGTGGRADYAPKLNADSPAIAAPALPERPHVKAPATLVEAACDCGQRGTGHLLTCAAWGSRRMLYPIRTPVPLAPQEPAASNNDDLTEEEAEALLGPCTCGQAPICLPTCARAGGPGPQAA